MVKLIRLPIGDADAVQGTFTHSARVMGDALVYCVVPRPTAPPVWGAVALPDEGDDGWQATDVQAPVFAGVTPQGRRVLVYRTGNRTPGTSDWDGTSSLVAALGAPSPHRELGSSIVVETTQPGPQGAPGETGPVGPPGPPGAAGGDAEVDDATIDRIAAAVVGRLFSEAPPDDHYGLPEYARFGTKLQDYIAVMVHAGFMTHVLATTDEAAAGMLASGYVPKVK